MHCKLVGYCSKLQRDLLQDLNFQILFRNTIDVSKKFIYELKI